MATAIVILLWFVCTIVTIHIDLLVNRDRGCRDSPADVWVISTIGPIALLIVLLIAIGKASKHKDGLQ
jgi:hypothetical protein